MVKKDSTQTLKKLNASFKTLVFQLSKNELELSEKVKELRDFAHIIAHDLRSPLAVAYSYQELIQEKIKEGTFDPKNDLQFIETVSNKLSNAMLLIDEMLHYAESGGKVELDNEFLVHDIVSQSLSNVSELIQKTKAMISVNIAHYSLKGSQALLASVLTNVLSNAMKYTKKEVSPIIDIMAKVEGNKKVLTITDNGMGIPHDKLNDIFEEFVRLEKDDGEKGSGIGLTSVKRILNAHGAKIEVESRMNEGSIFKIEFT
jgi:signal transduction histidine kinase